MLVSEVGFVAEQGIKLYLLLNGFDVTVLEGGYDFGPKIKSLSPEDASIRGKLNIQYFKMSSNCQLHLAHYFTLSLFDCHSLTGLHPLL
ncbi:uncharacterized protein [Primulina huaijiensis]|uniref:uncharacterized protein isoform X2 n=1 Tax=Primulina huaijiensis TaxID=1492673 RepID=UPI003CC6EDF7